MESRVEIVYSGDQTPCLKYTVAVIMALTYRYYLDYFIAWRKSKLPIDFFIIDHRANVINPTVLRTQHQECSVVLWY